MRKKLQLDSKKRGKIDLVVFFIRYGYNKFVTEFDCKVRLLSQAFFSVAYFYGISMFRATLTASARRASPS